MTDDWTIRRGRGVTRGTQADAERAFLDRVAELVARGVPGLEVITGTDEQSLRLGVKVAALGCFVRTDPKLDGAGAVIVSDA
jgi:hypothetical protein